MKFTWFLHPHRIFQEIQGFIAFLCGNICHFKVEWAKKNIFRQKKLKLTSFLHPHRIFQETQGFIAFLCGNICHFKVEWAKKYIFRQKKLNLHGFCTPIEFLKKLKVSLRFYVVIFVILK